VLTDEALGVTVFYQNAPFPCRHRVLAELEQKLEEARITRFATVSYPVGGPADGQTVLMLLDGGRDEDVRAIASRTMKVRKTGR
jgi:hypothetical protein